jgi:hypothetical protein
VTVAGPVLRGCDGFAFFWESDVNINKTVGPVNGVDMVFVNTSTRLIERAYSEYNTIQMLFGAGGNACFNGTAEGP